MLTTHLSMALPIDCIIVNGPIKSISISRNGIISLEEIECEYDPQKKALSLKQRKGVQIRSMSGITYIGRHKIFKLNISTCNFLSISGVGSVNVDTSTLNGYDCTINASNAVIKLIGVENLNKLNVNLQDSSKFFESSKGMISELNVDCGYGSILYFENKRKETIITRSSSTVCCSEGSGFSIYQEGGQISRERPKEYCPVGYNEDVMPVTKRPMFGRLDMRRKSMENVLIKSFLASGLMPF